MAQKVNEHIVAHQLHHIHSDRIALEYQKQSHPIGKNWRKEYRNPICENYFLNFHEKCCPGNRGSNPTESKSFLLPIFASNFYKIDNVIIYCLKK